MLLPRRVLALHLVAAAAVLAVAAATSSPPVEEVPGRGWRDGPVRYLLTEDEYRRFGLLKTDEARRVFVAQFWRKLDPDLSTPANEFRDRFERRCAEANERFEDALGPGWLTDRGRVLILLGEPDSVVRDPGDRLASGREIWRYDHPPGRISAPLSVVFYRDRSGGYRLEPETVTEDRARDTLALEEALQRARTAFRWGDLSGLKDLVGPLTDTLWGMTPAPERIGEGDVAPDVRSAAGEAPLDLRDGAYFFQAEDGAIVTLFSLDFVPEGDAGGSKGSAGFAAAAVLLDAGSGPLRPQGARVVKLERREPPSAPGHVVFAGRAWLAPGAYEVRYAVEDRVRRRLAVRSETLEVPALTLDEFSASSVVPAERFGPLSEGTSSSFAVGSEEVVPRAGATFHRGEPLRLYLQVYGAAPDPASGKPRVDVTFRFERASPHRFRRHGKPLSYRGAEGASLGLALPVGDWPSGDYRVIVDLHDRVRGSRIEARGAFRIAD